MTWDQRNWLEDFKTFPKCPRTWSKLKNWACYAFWKWGNFWEFWKVNFTSNASKLLMGHNFFQESSPKGYARPIDPKGSYFVIFNLLIEFLNLLIHLIKIKYKKNTNPCFSNLFVQHMHSLCTQYSCIIQKGKNLPWLAMVWWKKRIEKDHGKSNIEKH